MAKRSSPWLIRSDVPSDRFQSLVDSIQDYAILMLDVDGNVISWNAGAQKIKGYTAEDILGTHFSRFYPPEALESRLPWSELEEATASGRFEDDGWRVRKDGGISQPL